MSEEITPTEEVTEEPNGVEDASKETSEKDWKAIARMWEGRAKANKDKADKFDAMEEENKSELEKALERASNAEAEAKTLREKAEHDALVAKIATEKGVPTHLLTGNDEESLIASADALLAWTEQQRPNYPADTGGGSTPAITAESIEAIKDPVERVRARAQHPDLYR